MIAPFPVLSGGDAVLFAQTGKVVQLFGKQMNLLVEFLPLALLIIENLLRSVQIMQGGGENLRVVYD